MAMQPITLTSGMRANLVSLQNTNSLMEITQKRLASGKKVNSALDDPVAYFTAVAHEQRATDLASRKDEMSEAVQTIKAADAGIESITTLIAAAKSLAQSALSSDVRRMHQTLKTQYDKVLTQIDDMAGDSGYKGINLLSDTGSSDRQFQRGLAISKSGNNGVRCIHGRSHSSTDSAGTWGDPTAIQANITELDDAKDCLADSINQAVQQPEHHHRPPGIHPGHDQRPEGRRGRA